MDLTPNFSIPIPYNTANKPQVEAAFRAVDAALLASLALPHSPLLNSPNISIPLISAVDVGLNIANTNTTAGNISALAFSNANAYQAQIGVQNIGSGATAGGDFFIAIRAAGEPALAERLRVTGMGWTAANRLLGEADGSRLNLGYDGSTGYIRSVDTGNEFKNLKLLGKDVSLWAANGTNTAGEILRVSADAAGIGYIHLNGGLQQFTNTAFYPNAGASVNRLDRLLVGGAMHSDASFPNLVQDWMEEYGSISINGGDGIHQNGASAQVSILTHRDNYASAIGLFVGARTKLQTTGGPSVYAFSAVIVNDNIDPVVNPFAWAGYLEGIQATPEAGAVAGLEIEMRASGVDTVYLDPYKSFDPKQVQGLQLGVGCGRAATGQFDATTGILFFTNPMKWKAGITFTHTSLAPAGPGGTYSAIQFALDHQLQWFRSGGVGNPGILTGSLTTDASNRMQLAATGGVEIRAASSVVDSARNHFSLVSSDAPGIDIGPQMQFVGYNGSGGGSDPGAFATIAGRKENNTLINWAGYLQFSTMNAAGTLAEGLRLTSTGNLGLGTVTPGILNGGFVLSGDIFHLLSSTTHAQFALSASGSGLPVIRMENANATATKRVFDVRYDGANNRVRMAFVNEVSGATTQDNVLVLENTGNVGMGTSTFGTGAVRNFVIGNGTPSTGTLPTGAHFWVENVTSLVSGGYGGQTSSLGSQLRIKAKGLTVLSHMAVGTWDVWAAAGETLGKGVDEGIVSSYYPSVVLNVREHFAGDFSPTYVDPATGFGIAKRQGIASYIKTTATAGLSANDEVYGMRSFVDDMSGSGVTHLGKFYGNTGELRHYGAAQMNIARGLYGLYQKEGTGLTVDARGVLGLIFLATIAGSTLTVGDGVFGGFNVIHPATVTQGNGVRGRLEVTLSSGTFTSTEFRTIRASAPAFSLTGSGAVAIPLLTGVSIADHSGLSGVTTAYNLLSEGVNALNRFQGLVEAENKLSVKNPVTAPVAGVADSVLFYSTDDAAGHTIPSFFCEGTNVVSTGQADSASSVRVKMRINGVVRTLLAI